MEQSILKNDKGFTLIELIVVIVILGILAAIAVPRVVDSITRSRVNTLKTNLEEVKNAINEYCHLNNNILPATGVASLDAIPLISGRTCTSLGIFYTNPSPTGGAGSYDIGITDASVAPYNLNLSDITDANFSPSPNGSYTHTNNGGKTVEIDGIYP